MKKLFDSVLDLLLVVGALACVFTIGGGKWMVAGMNSENPNMIIPYTAMDEIQPGGFDVNSIDAQHTDPRCPPDVQSASADAQNRYLLGVPYLSYMQQSDPQPCKAPPVER